MMATGGRHIPVPLEEFKLYESLSKFYLIGTDKSKTVWRVLKINRSDPSNLKIQEDPASYSSSDDLVEKLEKKNRLIGGLNFVTECYGVAGLFKFLGPYYMVLITERKSIGTICGHTIYAVSNTRTIVLDKSSNQPKIPDPEESRYMKLLCAIDLTKEFFFSYSYMIMDTLQKNLSDGETGEVLYESMFVWNAHLTRALRDHLKTTRWTVALIHGFFEQAKLSTNGKDFIFTLIARRSRHYVGTRYIKRGINDSGKVANDVETEQIVCDDTSQNVPTRIASIAQRRGSIPLFWSQKFSGLNPKPDIILHKVDIDFKATKLHFNDLVERYGNPIVLLSLVKSHEKTPRESTLNAEFINAINHIKDEFPREETLIFLHSDMHKESRRRNANEMASLGTEAAKAFKSTGFFYCEVPPALRNQEALKLPILRKDHSGEWLYISQETGEDNIDQSNMSPELQTGVLRTNCLNSLDRTNVAQYVYSLIALAHQLYALRFIDAQQIGEDDELAITLMAIYERMGNLLALQYAGSTAYNQIFSDKRGQWKVATQLEKLKTALQRYLSSVFTDEEKQDALDLFLGHFQPLRGKPALWNLDSDVRMTIRRDASAYAEEVRRTFMKRSYSDSYIIMEEGNGSGNETPSSINGGAVPNEPSRPSVHQISDQKAESVHLNDPDYEGEASYSSDDEPIDIVSETPEVSRPLEDMENSISQKNKPVYTTSDDEDGPEVRLQEEVKPSHEIGGICTRYFSHLLQFT